MKIFKRFLFLMTIFFLFLFSCNDKAASKSEIIQFWIIDLERNECSFLSIDTLKSKQTIKINEFYLKLSTINEFIVDYKVKSRYDYKEFFIYFFEKFTVYNYRDKKEYLIYKFYFSKTNSIYYFNPQIGIFLINLHGENYKYLSCIKYDDFIIFYDNIIEEIFKYEKSNNNTQTNINSLKQHYILRINE